MTERKPSVNFEPVTLLVSAAQIGGGRSPIVETRDADYRWRIVVSQAKLGKLFRALEASIDYPNFKGEIHLRTDQCAKASAYTRFWSMMLDIQESERAAAEPDGHG